MQNNTRPNLTCFANVLNPWAKKVLMNAKMMPTSVNQRDMSPGWQLNMIQTAGQVINTVRTRINIIVCACLYYYLTTQSSAAQGEGRQTIVPTYQKGVSRQL